jgi:hypothetical protein
MSGSPHGVLGGTYGLAFWAGLAVWAAAGLAVAVDGAGACPVTVTVSPNKAAAAPVDPTRRMARMFLFMVPISSRRSFCPDSLDTCR